SRPEAKAKHFVRIFPKNDNAVRSSDATRRLLTTTVDVGSAKLGVKSIRLIKNNGISVECRSAAEASALNDKLTNHTDLSASLPSKSNPTFTFFWQGTDVDFDQILNDIKS